MPLVIYYLLFTIYSLLTMYHSPHPLSMLKKRWKILFISGLLLSSLTVGTTLLFPLQYRADAEVFIISQSKQGVDPYTTVKSAERIGENLARLVGTDDFFYKTINKEGTGLDSSDWNGLSDRARRKWWKKTVTGSVVFGTGVFAVGAYHANPEQAKRLAGAVANTLVTEGWQYVGGDVIIKLVNPPIASAYPVRPNIPLHALWGFLAGVLLAAAVFARR